MTIFFGNYDLLSRFRSGDRDALCTVYWFYVSQIESYVRRGLALAREHASAGARAAVADLVQEVFVRAFAESARTGYDGVREYGPLLLTIARNALIDHLRRRGRERHLDPDQLEHLLDSGTAPKPNDEPWEDPATMDLVEQYVAALPERERAVYQQRYEQGRSQMQAADALGFSRQQVRTLEERIRNGLVRAIAHARLAEDGRSGAPVSVRSAAGVDAGMEGDDSHGSR